jgi:hypothetical protein
LSVPIDWKGLRRDYEEDGLTAVELARRYGCDAGTIRKRARREGWSRGAHSGVMEGGGAKAGQDQMEDNRSLWEGVKKRLVKGLESSDVKAGLEELKVAKMAGEVLTNVIKGERLALGLEDMAEDEADGVTAEMAEATAPSGTDEAVERK